MNLRVFLPKEVMIFLIITLANFSGGTLASAATPTFSEFAASIFQRPDGAYVVDDDVPIRDENELYQYYLAKFFPTSSTGTGNVSVSLAIRSNTGSDVKWSDSQKLNLTYCISTGFNSYASGVGHLLVRSAIQAAAESWKGAAQVNYTHVNSQDSACASSTSVLFRVLPYIPIAINDSLLASAFFPDYPANLRNLYINVNAVVNPGFGLTLSGLLRHELGHTLGFVHEHIRPESGAPWCSEGSGWRPLTTYDVFSVMHYRSGCNGVPGDYYLTSNDKSGARSVYGTWPSPPPPNQKPVANVGTPLYSAMVNERIVFDATGSYDPEGQPLTYKWDFGDGSPVADTSTPIVEYRYGTIGSYTVKLIVSDGALSSNPVTTLVTIKSLAWLIPIIDLLFE